MLTTPHLLPFLVGLPVGEGAPMPVAPSLIASLILLCCSAFFSGSETALFSLQPLDRQALRESGSKVETLLERPRQTLATLLIGNETVNITLSSVTAGLLLSLAPDKPWLNIVIVTPILLMGGEILPKFLGFRYNRTLAPLLARPLAWLSVAFTPFRWVLTRIADGALLLTGGTTAPREAELREAQLRALIDEGNAAGTILTSERDMLHKAFDFGDLTVNRLMTPRLDMQSIRLNDPWADLLATVRNDGFSRLPVWQGKPDNIVGILLVKQLLPIIRGIHAGERQPPGPRELQKLLLPVRYVPATKRAEDMLREFRSDRFHMAIVVDEHGNIVGLVTLDDLLAELVGDLLDETDIDDPEVTALGSDSFRVWAGMDVDDFEQRFALRLPEGDYTTVGGFIIHAIGEVPEKGREVEYGGTLFTVVGVDERRVTEVSIRPAPPRNEEGAR